MLLEKTTSYNQPHFGERDELLRGQFNKLKWCILEQNTMSAKNEEKEFLIVANGIILKQSENGAKVLLVRSKNNSFYGLPGGKQEPHESIDAALQRELGEEITLNTPYGITPYGIFKRERNKKGRIQKVALFCYTIDIPGNNIGWQIDVANEIESYAWVDSNDIGTTDILPPGGNYGILWSLKHNRLIA